MIRMLIAGCLFIGVGIGMWLGDAGPGALIGLGAGLVLQFLFSEDGPFKKRGRRKSESGKSDGRG